MNTIINKVASILLLVLFSSIQATAGDFITFEDGHQPHFENEDYEVWVMSILNEKDNAYVNLSIFPKKKFRHYSYYKLKKSDRTDIVSAWELKLVESDSTKTIGILPFVRLDTGWAEIGHIPNFFDNGRIETSANLNDKEINRVSLKFGGHISPMTKRISLLQNGENKYFSFKEIRVSFPHNKEWDCKYHSKKDLVDLIDSSTDPICGIYEQNGVQYACVPDGNSFNLVRLEDSDDMIWRFGDIRAKFNRTAVSGVYKGKYKNIYTKEDKKDYSFIWNGDFIEIVGKYTVPGYMFGDFYVPSKEEESHETYTKIYPLNNSSVNSSQSSERWSGSGFALLNGYIITNCHVAEGANNIEIYGIDGDFSKSKKAKIIGKDKGNDLALLLVEDLDNLDFWKSIPYSVKSTMSDVGEDIFALGYPLIGTMGEEVKLTTGVISSRSGFNGDVANYQISAPIQPGNSGGPMFDEDGNIVGIVCAKHEGAENVGYAIKTSYLLNLIESVADIAILPKCKELKGLTMKNQVKLIRDYTFLIKCSK